jgi:hypothetical protein
MLRLPLHSRRSLVAARTSVALQRRFAAELMSTVWIVPFLMFFDVTIMVAAVPLAAATTAATTAATSAFFMI